MKTLRLRKVAFVTSIVTSAVWGLMAIYSYLCAPTMRNPYGYYQDTIDNMCPTHIRWNYGEVVSDFYQPLSWLIEPRKEGEASVDTCVALMFVIGLMFFLFYLTDRLSEDNIKPVVRKTSFVVNLCIIFYVGSYFLLGFI